jgi:hypothetical protein
MIELLAKKADSGDIFVSIAALHMSNDEWGRARAAIVQALHKGGLSDQSRALDLFEDINRRLFNSYNI